LWLLDFAIRHIAAGRSDSGIAASGCRLRLRSRNGRCLCLLCLLRLLCRLLRLWRHRDVELLHVFRKAPLSNGGLQQLDVEQLDELLVAHQLVAAVLGTAGVARTAGVATVLGKDRRQRPALQLAEAAHEHAGQMAPGAGAHQVQRVQLRIQHVA